MRLTEFDYALPPERIAQSPLEARDHSRLMVLDRQNRSMQHRTFREIGEFLRAGDVLVLNATRVFPARLRGRKRSGGKAELLLLEPLAPSLSPGERPLGGGSRWRALVRGASAPGVDVVFPENLSARLETLGAGGEWIVCFSREGVRAYLDRHGEMPLPPYIKRLEKNMKDSETYQTVFAREEGSIAAPTAGFHFTGALLKQLGVQGVKTIEVVLHVGWGTFRPIRTENIQDHAMLPENYQVSAETAAKLNAARRDGRRIIAVGTTSARTLESVYDPDNFRFRAGSGAAKLFIYPGYRFRGVDALITNFHLPHSTPLLLACAFYSGEPSFSLRVAYDEAIRGEYRFYSYGDAMFIQ
ncbi:MAG: tRNA preQ1(34) S-adenosylmethionine ribosyltransferase-isomerase QueA [Elusimicrobia bacterium RIFCSPLOWO2_01_FULL_59_12]|nr:MAG: tRNA preQ1(34) S-adenosylmethionine ribosyltransferase-isomerase QueA [Elusimicrobia bacterium RIFCSPLOWO2_01_FULL_59_12]